MNAKDALLELHRKGRLLRKAYDGSTVSNFAPSVSIAATHGTLSTSPIALRAELQGISGNLSGITLDARIQSAPAHAPRFVTSSTKAITSSLHCDPTWSCACTLGAGSRQLVNAVGLSGDILNSDTAEWSVPIGELDLSTARTGVYRIGFTGATCFIDDHCIDHTYESRAALVSIDRPVGDVNGDGTVDERDVAVFFESIGAKDLDLDLNGDGEVDAADLAVLSSNLGSVGTWSIELEGLSLRGGCSTSPVVSFAGTFNGHKYFWTQQDVTAFDGQWIAQQLGGYLASIGSADENAFVASLSPASMWIGLGVNHHGAGCGYGTYTLSWDSGEPVGFTSWGTSCEPNNDFGTESRVAINEHRGGGWNDLTPSRTLRAVIEFPASPLLQITSPTAVASPQSLHLAVRGVSQTHHSLTLRVLAKDLSQVTTYPVQPDADGTWEQTVNVSMSDCSYLLLAQDDENPEVRDVIVINDYRHTGSLPNARFDLLRTGDIFVSQGAALQSYLYGANWTHAAIYGGGGPDGTPQITEAAIERFATTGSLGSVRTLGLDDSDVGTATAAQILRLDTALPSSQRMAIAAQARGLANSGTAYWAYSDFSQYIFLSYFWDPMEQAPPSYFALAFFVLSQNLRHQVDAANPCICSTLVRRVYLDQTGVDVAGFAPISGGLLGGLDSGYRDFLARQRLWVVPDSIAACPRLRQIR